MGNGDANHDATKDVSNDAGKDKHRFKSIGTIRVPITKQDGDKQERFIYFTPIDAYSVKHEGKTYALFFRNKNGRADCISTVLPDSGVGVRMPRQFEH